MFGFGDREYFLNNNEKNDIFNQHSKNEITKQIVKLIKRLANKDGEIVDLSQN
jgi:DNA-binding winged helix-turn-helix (wHTH) protein